MKNVKMWNDEGRGEEGGERTGGWRWLTWIDLQ